MADYAGDGAPWVSPEFWQLIFFFPGVKGVHVVLGFDLCCVVGEGGWCAVFGGFESEGGCWSFEGVD